jgi:hypothetical protein
MILSRDKNGRFQPKAAGTDPAAVDACSPPASAATEAAAGPIASASIAILEVHRQQLASLKAEYDKLCGLAERSEQINQESGNVECAIDAVEERLLVADLEELELELFSLNRRKESLAAQSAIISKQQHEAENVLQKRLALDITACERLAKLIGAASPSAWTAAAYVFPASARTRAASYKPPELPGSVHVESSRRVSRSAM